MDTQTAISAAVPTADRVPRSGMISVLAPILLVMGLTSFQAAASAADDGFSSAVVSAASTNWLNDAPFQSPAPDEAEVVAEHAAAPHDRQTADVLMPDRVAVRRMRIGGLYGP